MNPIPALIAAAGALVALGGCSASRKQPAPGIAPAAVTTTPLEKPLQAMPRAVIYKTAGNFNQNVPVQAGPGGKIISYPAPTDVSPERSEPLQLADGFLLDRRGISTRSRFTRYTYAEYAALEQAPTEAELIKAIIPGTQITEMYTLPMTPSEAAADTAAVNNIILHHRSELTPVKGLPLVLEARPAEEGE